MTVPISTKTLPSKGLLDVIVGVFSPFSRGHVWSTTSGVLPGPRFGVDLRVEAVADDPARVHTLVGGVIAAVRTLEVPGVGVSVVRTSIDGFDRVSLPWFWRSVIAPSELVSLTAWPIGPPPLPGVPSPHRVRLTPDRSLDERGLVLGRATALRPKGPPVAIKPADQLQGHLHLIGPTGLGKSTLLASLALQDFKAGFGLCFIDPKGGAVEELLARIPSHPPGDVMVIDPRDPAPVGLASLTGSDPDRTADSLLAVFHSLYADNLGPRSQDIIHAGLLTLARHLLRLVRVAERSRAPTSHRAGHEQTPSHSAEPWHAPHARAARPEVRTARPLR